MIANADLMGESRLLKRLRAGEPGAFEELVHDYGPQMLAVIRRYLPQDHDSHDALQESFLSAFRAIRKFQNEARLATWLHRIAVNAALMRIRAQKRREERSLEDLFPRSIARSRGEADLANFAVDQDETIEDSETREWVRHCISKLPETHRSILILRDIDERSTEEAARLLEITKANVKTRLHRARAALKELIEAHAK